MAISFALVQLFGRTRKRGIKMIKDTAWSFSRLDSYELCPMKYQQESVLKKYPFKSNAAADFGKYAHKAFEDLARKQTALPMDLQHHMKHIAPIINRPGEALIEQRLALTKDFQPTGFFDNDVWVRAIIDFAKIDTNLGLIVDWKFGKRKDGFDQVDLMYAVLSAFKPELEAGVGGYYWGKEKKYARKVYKKADVPEIWSGFLPRIARYEKAHREIDFPCKPNFLCRNYCPVKDCQHNGI